LRNQTAGAIITVILFDVSEVIFLQPDLPPRRTAGNESTGLIKLAALVFMFCDHAGKMLLPKVPEMRMLGRLAFPLYAWCLVVGFCYTRSPLKYMLRLAAVGLVSQPLYMAALNHTWLQPNIFLTLLLALGGLWAMRSRILPVRVIVPAAMVLLSVVLHADYGWKGVLLIYLLYAARSSRGALAAVMTAFCLYWGSSSTTVVRLFGWTIPTNLGSFSTLLSPWLKQQALAILSLPLILWHCPVRLRLPKWVDYALYPAHLVILWGLEQLL